MKSLDANLLYYATSRDCAEHAKARPLLEQAARETGD